LFKLLDSLGFPRERQKLVINRYTSLPGSLKAIEVAERLDRDVDHVLAFDKRMIITANTGEPFVLRPSRFSSFGRELRRMIDDAAALGRRGGLGTAPNGAATARLAGLPKLNEQGESSTSPNTSASTSPAASAAGPFPSRHLK
jgi:pilus assembly protein CpaE